MVQRRHYRVAVDDRHDARAHVLLPGDVNVAVELVDVTYTGAGILAPVSEGCPTLDPGAHLCLRLAIDETRLEIPAVVANARPEGAGQKLGLQWPEHRLEVPTGLMRLFNRRQAFRVASSQESPVKVVFGEQAGCGVNIGLAGAAISMIPDLEAREEGSEVELRLCLPDQPAHAITATVRHRTPVEGVVLVGVQFCDAGRSQPCQDALQGYVMTRQREDLGRRPGAN